jgi:hypothetical protein
MNIQTSGEYRVETPAVEGQASKPRDGIQPRDTAFMFHIRAHRIFTRRFTYPGMSPSGNAQVSLTEVDRGDSTGRPFIGAATMKVYNVAPGNGFVDVRGEIDWDNDLNIRVNILAF